MEKSIPSCESCNNSKSTSSADERNVGSSSRAVVVEVSDGKHEECQVKGEEEEEERDGGSKSQRQEKEGEDEPSLL